MEPERIALLTERQVLIPCIEQLSFNKQIISSEAIDRSTHQELPCFVK